MNELFASHKLNEQGIRRIAAVRGQFDRLLNTLTSEDKVHRSGKKRKTLRPILPEGRYLSIVKTKLEEACMFAVKAVSCDPANQATE